MAVGHEFREDVLTFVDAGTDSQLIERATKHHTHGTREQNELRTNDPKVYLD